MSLMCRRDLFKAGLVKDYTTIRNNKHPVEGELFGQDLTERLKTVKKSNLASKQLTKYQTSFAKRYDREILNDMVIIAGANHELNVSEGLV